MAGEAEKLSGLSKHFNAVTFQGRANVSANSFKYR